MVGWSNNARSVTITSTPLPVVPVSFTANAVGTSVRLRWHTASELDVDHFEVEASTDGRRSATPTLDHPWQWVPCWKYTTPPAGA